MSELTGPYTAERTQQENNEFLQWVEHIQRTLQGTVSGYLGLDSVQRMAPKFRPEISAHARVDKPTPKILQKITRHPVYIPQYHLPDAPVLAVLFSKRTQDPQEEYTAIPGIVCTRGDKSFVVFSDGTIRPFVTLSGKYERRLGHTISYQTGTPESDDYVPLANDASGYDFRGYHTGYQQPVSIEQPDRSLQTECVLIGLPPNERDIDPSNRDSRERIDNILEFLSEFVPTPGQPKKQMSGKEMVEAINTRILGFTPKNKP